MTRIFSPLLSLSAVVALQACVSDVAARPVADTLPVAVVNARLATKPALDTAYLAGGCFWGVEAVFEHVKGVIDVVSGYAGGKGGTPSYEQVSSGTTGHAESVRVVYDPSQVTYGELLRVFFSVAHDPTQLNRQGPDVGTQYRSAIFYGTPEQHRIAESYIAQLTQAKAFRSPIVTQLAPLDEWFDAERYHQDFAARNPDHPYIVYHDAPKVARLKSEFATLYREVR
jgi:peptide-methionine (S)-S-oxide reductase